MSEIKDRNGKAIKVGDRVRDVQSPKIFRDVVNIRLDYAPGSICVTDEAFAWVTPESLELFSPDPLTAARDELVRAAIAFDDKRRGAVRGNSSEQEKEFAANHLRKAVAAYKLENEKASK